MVEYSKTLFQQKRGWSGDCERNMRLENRSQNLRCCILRGPDGERIVDVVPGGTELEPQIKTGRCARCTYSQ